MSGEQLAFGPFRLAVDERALYRDGERVALTPKALDTLVVLAGRANSVVPTSELRAAVWPGTSVGGGSLARNISDLRKALGECARGEFIETIAKRGYRFAAPVRRVAERSSPLTQIWLSARSTRGTRGARQRCESLEELVLARLRALGAGPVRPLPARRRESQDELVVSLAVSRTNRSLRVALEISRAPRGRPLWAEVLEQGGEAFAAESELADQIAGAVSLWLAHRTPRALSRRHTQSTEAYRLYLRGRLHISSRSASALRAAATCFESALRIDPEYALAYAGLSRALALLPMVAAVPSAAFMPRARAAAANALAIDETLSEARAVLAFVKWHYHWHWKSAERELRRIIRFQPRDAIARQWLGLMLAEQGRFGAAVEQLERARSLAPGSGEVIANLATVEFLGGRYERSLASARRALAGSPVPTRARLVAGWALEQMGRLAESLRELERGLEDAPDSPGMLGALGHVFGTLRNPSGAEAVLEQLERLPPEVTHYSRGLVFSALGRCQDAVRSFASAVGHRDFQLVLLHVDPRLREIRKLPGYREVARAVGSSA